MKVSILVPIYNVEKFFSRCLESLFNQTYQNIEYVFVNDCTPDNSMVVLHNFMEKYPSRAKLVRIIENTNNCGIAIVRNTLIKNATGDYVLFVDSDDWIEEDMVEKLVDKAIQTDADVVGCDYYEDYPNKAVLCKQHYPTDRIEAMKAMTLLKIKGVFVYGVGKSLTEALLVGTAVYRIKGIGEGHNFTVVGRRPKKGNFGRLIVDGGRKIDNVLIKSFLLCSL